MKALPFAYPEDAAVREVSDEFLFGESLLISPVTEAHAISRKVVLPAGDKWIDFWTGQAYSGGQTIVAEAPVERLPVLVRQGSIVPMGPVVQDSSQRQDPIELRIYGGKDASFDLYQDSGDGYGYEKGARATIRFRWDDRHQTLSIGDRSGSFDGMAGQQTFRIVLVKAGHGTGDESTSACDRTVNYNGHGLSVDLGKTTEHKAAR
jgi:alpha-D-xyloside xylohydrolase